MALALFSQMIPLLGMVMLGIFMKAYFLQTDMQWVGIDRLNFYVFIPSLIFNSLTTSNVEHLGELNIVVILLVLLLTAVILLFIARRLFLRKISKPALSTLLQTTTRWNATIALIVAHSILDTNTIALISVSLILLVPTINILNVVFMTRHLTDERIGLKKLLINVAKNPIFIACILGAICTLSGIKFPVRLDQITDQIGQASIPVTLLSVGASIRFINFKNTIILSIATILIKMVACPLVVLLFCVAFHLERSETTALVLIASMPTSMNGISLAREMGGDHVLYAEIGTLQTVVSVMMIPFWILVSQSF